MLVNYKMLLTKEINQHIIAIYQQNINNKKGGKSI